MRDAAGCWSGLPVYRVGLSFSSSAFVSVAQAEIKTDLETDEKAVTSARLAPFSNSPMILS